MSKYVMFTLVSLGDKDQLFKELDCLGYDVGRVHEGQDVEDPLDRHCYVNLKSDQDENSVLEKLQHDPRITEAYVPAPRYLVW